MNQPKLTGLLAATYTPFHADGALNLDAIEKQAAYLAGNGVTGVFIGGTTGEGHSLSLAERLALTERWSQAARGTGLRVTVHVGSNCLADARTLAAHAEQKAATAIAAITPCYFKPRDIPTLVRCMSEIASAAPHTPFYYYDIPPMTGVHLPMADFLTEAAPRIPNLAGLKFSNSDLMTFQLCLRANGGQFAVLWGCDEFLLAALALGGTGAVGSTYNFAAPVYHRLQKAFAAGDWATAREEQFRSVRLVQCLARAPGGSMGAARALMELLGVPVGPARLPHTNPTPEQKQQLRRDLEQLGFFQWIS
jgi:N-acetylneuraminate lyase